MCLSLLFPPRLPRCFLLIHLTQLTCDGAYVIPRNTGNADKYPYDVASLSNIWSTYVSYSVELGPNQVCTLFGASSGSTAVSGRDYINAGYNLNVDDLWRRNFIVLVGFVVLFSLTQTFVIELVPVSISVLFSECRSYYLCE